MDVSFGTIQPGKFHLSTVFLNFAFGLFFRNLLEAFVEETGKYKFDVVRWLSVCLLYTSDAADDWLVVVW